MLWASWCVATAATGQAQDAYEPQLSGTAGATAGDTAGGTRVAARATNLILPYRLLRKATGPGVLPGAAAHPRQR